jgi:hypothetical protein
MHRGIDTSESKDQTACIAKGNCQNLCAKSSFAKTLDPDNFMSSSSRFGITKSSFTVA